MARKLRVSYPRVAEHIIQHGNNRQVIFANAEDTRAYITWLKQYAKLPIKAWHWGVTSLNRKLKRLRACG